MKVIFVQDVPGVAQAGEVKEVANGYGRNFLIPRNLAKPATKETLRDITAQKHAESRRKLQEEQQLVQIAQQLDGATITLEGKAGSKGHLYGSITNADIAKAIKEQLNIEVDKRHVELPQPIRELGIFTAKIRLASNISPVIQLLVKEGSDHDGK